MDNEKVYSDKEALGVLALAKKEVQRAFEGGRSGRECEAADQIIGRIAILFQGEWTEEAEGTIGGGRKGPFSEF